MLLFRGCIGAPISSLYPMLLFSHFFIFHIRKIVSPLFTELWFLIFNCMTTRKLCILVHQRCNRRIWSTRYGFLIVWRPLLLFDHMHIIVQCRRRTIVYAIVRICHLYACGNNNNVLVQYRRRPTLSAIWVFDFGYDLYD